MFNKFFVWLDTNRKPIGYSFGGLNLVVALIYALMGEYGLAMLWTVIGGFMIQDAWEDD